METDLTPKAAVFDKATKLLTLGQFVRVRLPSEITKLIKLEAGKLIALGKFGTFSVDEVVGYPLGQSFEILENHKVKPIGGLLDPHDDALDGEAEADELIRNWASAETNQEVKDLGTEIQKMTTAEIEELKKTGGAGVGKSIIEKIIANHESFEKKTVFSQEKYLKRKQQKYLRRFTLDYAGASQVLLYYYQKDPSKVLDMSEESLGLMMSYANVKQGGRYLLVDETGGVVLYAMMERMHGEGTIVVAHENEHPNHSVLDNSNYSDDLIDLVVKPVNWLQFFHPEEERLEWTDLPVATVEGMMNNKRRQYERRKRRANDVNGAIQMVETGNFDALILATTLHTPTLLPKLVEKVGGSRPIVVYSQFKEVVVETQHAVSKDLRVLAPTIFETRVRPYQTIPGRIHPLMTMKGFGGYVMWATRVFPKEGIVAVGRGISKMEGRKKQKVEGETTEGEVSTVEVTPAPETQ